MGQPTIFPFPPNVKQPGNNAAFLNKLNVNGNNVSGNGEELRSNIGVDALGANAASYGFLSNGINAGPALQDALNALPSLSTQKLFIPDGGALISTAVIVPNTSAEITFGIGLYNFAVPLTVNGNRNQSFFGTGHNSVLQTVASTHIFAWSGSQSGNPAERLTEFKRMALRGNSIGLTGVRTPPTNVNSFFDGFTLIEGVSANGFETANFEINASNYVTNLVGIHSSDAGTGLYVGLAADTNVFFSTFTKPRVGPMVHFAGIQNRLIGNVLDRGGAGGRTEGLGPDLLISAGGSGAGGGTTCAFNKHGPEGEVPGRPKIRIQDTVAPTTALGGDTFVFDHFYCYLGGKQTVFDVLNPTSSILIDGQYFADAGLIVNDKPAASGGVQGGGVFGPTNRVNNSGSNPQHATDLFRHGGVGFSDVTAPFNVAHINAPNAHAGPMQNRLSQPLNISSWSFDGAKITVTGGQADPWGGTDAFLVEKASPNTSTGISNAISTTDLLDDMGRPSGPASVTASIAAETSTATGTASIGERASFCYFVGSISDGAGNAGTILTVTDIGSELIQLGKLITNINVASGTSIVNQLTGPTGGAGTYTVSNSQLVASSPMRIPITYAVMTVSTQLTGIFLAGDELSGSGVAANTFITGQISSNGAGMGGAYRLTTLQTVPSTTITGTRTETVMTVTSVASGDLREGGTLAGTGVSANSTILEQRSGAFGKEGTYIVSPAQTVSSTTITSTIRNGRIVVSLPLRAGTSRVADVIVRDGTFGGIIRQQLSLSTGWKNYKFSVAGLQAGLSPTIVVYPGGVNTSADASIYMAHPSVSDFGSEWLPTQALNQPVALGRTLLFSAELTPANVAANTSAEQTFTVTGILATDRIRVTAPSTAAGIVLGNCRAASANTVGIEWGNFTGGALAPPAGTYKFEVIRERC